MHAINIALRKGSLDEINLGNIVLVRGLDGIAKAIGYTIRKNCINFRLRSETPRITDDIATNSVYAATTRPIYYSSIEVLHFDSRVLIPNFKPKSYNTGDPLLISLKSGTSFVALLEDADNYKLKLDSDRGNFGNDFYFYRDIRRVSKLGFDAYVLLNS